MRFTNSGKDGTLVRASGMLTQTVPIGKHAAGGDKAVDRVTDRSHQDPELVPAVERLLLDAEYHRPEILVVREVVPVLRAVEILLVGLLLDRGELEALILLPLLLDGGLLPRHVVRVERLVLLEQAEAVIFPLQHQRALLHRLLLHLLGIGGVAIALALVPDRVRRDLLPRAFDPVAGRGYQIVRELLTELIYGEIYSQLAFNSKLADHRADIWSLMISETNSERNDDSLE